jgi:hypothetical protein
MSAGYLLSPAKRYLNLTISTVCAVTYNKIIAYPFPMVAFPVPFVDDSGISEICC